jgi:RNA-directed DNA polymerase
VTLMREMLVKRAGQILGESTSHSGGSLAASTPSARDGWNGCSRNSKRLELNEAKTRLVDIRHTSINFMGFGFTWRQSRQGRGYLHVEPDAKSRTAMRRALRGLFNPWTLGRPIGEVATEANRTLRGWAAYFNFRNSTAVMSNLRRYSENLLRRCLWRKHGCTQGLRKGYPSERLHDHYGLCALPITAASNAGR